jgi:signal transduction histidine kinase
VDPAIAVTICLTGFFAFAAIHYAIQWWLSRGERVLLAFWIQCAMHAVVCMALVSFFRAKTVPDSQAALNRMITIGMPIGIVALHFYACLADRRDRAFRALVTSLIVFVVVWHQWAPLRGTVLALQTMQLPGGVTRLIPVRTPPSASLPLVYLTGAAIQGYGIFVACLIWKRDRTGGVLVAISSAAVLAGIGLGFLIDYAKVRAPYIGPTPHAITVACMALFLSRTYAARGVRLTLALRETQEALASLQAEQRGREEAEAARQTALAALVQAQRQEIASQLAAGVAHDFNNVLNVISVWLSVLLNGSGSPADKEYGHRALVDAQKQGQALSRQLVTLARPEARSLTRFSLDRPILTTVQTLKPAMPHGIELNVDAPATPEVEADEAEVQQVVYNLVLNARDAMSEGGSIQVKAGLETSPIPIGVVGGTLAAGRWATISVVDSGPGIDPSIRDRIFDLFFTTKGPERGTGLGLATVLRIAKNSGGGVVLDTEVGRGTAFKVYFPAA